ncbi:PilZ domain-containing protein [Pelagibacterium luteolum]|uniref:PilZ domain-containing protein n=1 Tax=Pelagibacterium luteolum TaxID=440168 RepID=A0A1G7RS82_9HYPH|nr:PilZ domain-containing protein [Pelagibacterium luteolum]SDG13626.1 PilZ domain-containing protein [Pelagibacterium luteolum]
MATPAKSVADATFRSALDDSVRLLANMPGRYHLEKWKHVQDRKVSEFACRIQRISPAMMGLAAPVSGNVGDWVVTHFPEFGRLRGQVQRTLGFGFTMALELSEAEKQRLADKIVWLGKRKNFAVSDLRRHTRIYPRNPESTLVLADGRLVPCFVIDLSRSGAAVSADIEVKIGTPMALGSVVGRIVRTLEPGFAIQFVEMLPESELERRLIRTAAELLPELRERLHHH